MFVWIEIQEASEAIHDAADSQANIIWGASIDNTMGDKVRVTVKFRGREMSRRELGQRKLTAMADLLKEDAVIEQAARTEGRIMFMVMAASPKLKAAAAAAAKERQKLEEENKAAKAARQAAKSSGSRDKDQEEHETDSSPDEV